jgi:hypothetical protein
MLKMIRPSFKGCPRRAALLAAALLFAHLAATRAAAQVGGNDAAILPFIDEGTFIVARLDVERVDHDVLGKFMDDAMEVSFARAQIPENLKAQVKQSAQKSVADAKQWLTDIAAAGGKTVYVLVDRADQEGPGGGGPVVVVPLAAGADAEKIKEVLSRNAGNVPVENVGKAVVLGQGGSVERLRKLHEAAKPAARADLAAALAAAAKDAPLRIAYVPGESTRALIEKNLTELPKELGGGDPKALSRGVRYAGIGVVQKPAVMANVTLRATDAGQAKAIMDILEKGKAHLKEAAAGTPQEESTNKQLEATKPKLAADTITLNMDPLTAQSIMMGIAMRRMGQAGSPPPAPGTAPPAPKDGDGL